MKGVLVIYLAPGHWDEASVDEEELIERLGGWFHGNGYCRNTYY